MQSIPRVSLTKEDDKTVSCKSLLTVRAALVKPITKGLSNDCNIGVIAVGGLTATQRNLLPSSFACRGTELDEWVTVDVSTGLLTCSDSPLIAVEERSSRNRYAVSSLKMGMLVLTSPGCAGGTKLDIMVR